jgi:hypothetical protein
MKSSSFRYLALATLAVAVAFAQGPRGPQGNPDAPRSGAGLDMARQQTIEGAISSVQIAHGARYPSIVVSQNTIRIAPVWYLLENDFELAAGDVVKVLAAPALNDPALHAIAIEKVKDGTALVMRSEAGLPLWTRQPRPGNGAVQAGPRFGGGCLDPASIATVTGVVDSVDAGIGIQHPTVSLKVDGKLMPFKIGPERILLEADFELKPGATLTVRYAVATCTGELIALALTDAAGNTLVLRSDDGRPAWN